MGENVLLRVKPHKISIKVGKSSQLVLCFIGPFEVVKKVNLVAYQIVLLPALVKMHYVFHVSYLKRYMIRDNHVIEWNALKV